MPSTLDTGPLTEVQFRCSICLDIFKNPVSIPCGHNFCLGCIKRFWDTRHKSECPLCKETFKKRPDLRINVDLKDITEKFKWSLMDKPSFKPAPQKRRVSRQVSKSDNVFCDVCVGLKMPAVKSCLVCRVSYCEGHLLPHLRDPVMTKHMLTDPGTFATSHMCKKHSMLLEMFCKKDQVLVCPKCTDRDHRYHEVVTIEKESRKIRNDMKKADMDFHHMIQTRMDKMREIEHTLEQSKKVKDNNIQMSVQVYTTVISAIEKHQAAVIEETEEKQEEAEKKAQELLRALSLEVNELQYRRSEIQQLELTEDPLHLIQSIPSLVVLPFTNDLTEMKIDMNNRISTVRNTFSKLVEICQELEKKLATEEVNKLSEYAADVSMDPSTAAGWLFVSVDGKKVSVSETQSRPSLLDDPRRFDSCVAILGKQSFTTGRHYWVVQVGEKTDWDLGIAKESINRKGAITVRPDCGFWAICRRKGGCLSACTSPSIPLPLKETPRKVGIFLDYKEGVVSFYDAEAKVHMYTYSGCDFTEPLYPYFNPCLRDNGKNTAPLIICSLESVIGGDAAAF